MAVVHEGTDTSTSGYYTGAITFSKTTGSGANRLLRVGVTRWDSGSGSITSVTYNGVGLSSSGTEAAYDAWRSSHYTLVAPASGANNVVVTMAGMTDSSATVGAATYEGVDQTTPTSGYATATGTTTTPSVVVASATDDLVVDLLANYGPDGVPAVGASQILEWSALHDVNGSGSREAGAASVTMSWTVTSGANGWAIAGVNLKAAVAGDPALSVLIGEPIVGSSLF